MLNDLKEKNYLVKRLKRSINSDENEKTVVKVERSLTTCREASEENKETYSLNVIE